jgi:hypothetical protein
MIGGPAIRAKTGCHERRRIVGRNMLVPAVVKVIKGMMPLEQAVATAASELKAEGYRSVHYLGYARHPDGVRQPLKTWVIQFEVDGGR